MAQYFDVSIRYGKMLDNGTVKKVTEKFLVDALSLTESESIVIEKMSQQISGEFFVSASKTTNVAEVCGDIESDKFYLAKVGFITIDEVTAKEKRNITPVIVGAEDFKQAYDNLNVAMQTTMADWELVSLSEATYKGLF